LREHLGGLASSLQMVAGLVLRQRARSLKPPSGVSAVGLADFVNSLFTSYVSIDAGALKKIQKKPKIYLF